MNILRFAALILLLLGATVALAEGPQAVLTTDGTVFTVVPNSGSELRLSRRAGTQRSTLLVPTTEDDALDTDAQLVWDKATSTLFVVWHRSGERVDQILLARLYSDGTWSDPILVATGSSVTRLGLRVEMTRAAIDTKRSATLIHAAWWSMGAQPVAEYALVAFEGREHVSTVSSDLKTIAGVSADAIELEAMTEVLHPPLAMDRSGVSGVDVVFGSPSSTSVTRVTIEPRLRADARLWKPGRKGGGITPKAGLMSASGKPVQAILSRGRIVLYAAEDRFRFTILDGGKWSPQRMIQLDDSLTSDQVVSELLEAIEQLDDDTPPPTVIE